MQFEEVERANKSMLKCQTHKCLMAQSDFSVETGRVAADMTEGLLEDSGMLLDVLCVSFSAHDDTAG